MMIRGEYCGAAQAAFGAGADCGGAGAAGAKGCVMPFGAGIASCCGGTRGTSAVAGCIVDCGTELGFAGVDCGKIVAGVLSVSSVVAGVTTVDDVSCAGCAVTIPDSNRISPEAKIKVMRDTTVHHLRTGEHRSSSMKYHVAQVLNLPGNARS